MKLVDLLLGSNIIEEEFLYTLNCYQEYAPLIESEYTITFVDISEDEKVTFQWYIDDILQESEIMLSDIPIVYIESFLGISKNLIFDTYSFVFTGYSGMIHPVITDIEYPNFITSSGDKVSLHNVEIERILRK